MKINSNVSIILLQCNSCDIRPIFGKIQVMLNLENRKCIMLFKNYSNVDGKIFAILDPYE